MAPLTTLTTTFDFDPAVPTFAVFGNPVLHSQSPVIHRLFARQCGVLLDYQAIEIATDEFADAVMAFRQAGGKGLNITVPFKQEAYAICHHCTPRAQHAHSVNTIWFDETGAIHGDTTDATGLFKDLANHGIAVAGREVLVLGAGGSVRAVLEPLLHAGPASLSIVNRTLSRAEELVEHFASQGHVRALTYEQLADKAANKAFDIVINATSLSLQQLPPPLPDDLLRPAACCYDFMYSDIPTVFMQWARNHGAETILDGKGMLVEQAAAGFHIWHGVQPDTAPVIRQLASAAAG